ncbi:uncharacterized protein LOC135694801 [Rhopilema esculentum]|uniref:uncharacterized protein LOC135694801 n=1 Tax=Rhopilema esculentum TaxID=499914 RepID=UPI0031E16D6D
MDDLKLYAKNVEQINSLVRTVHIFSTDIGMEFGIKKCGVLILKRGKIIRSKGTELPNGDKLKEVREEGYIYLGIVELDKIKEEEMKGKIIKEYKRKLSLILKSKLNGKNKVIAINTWEVAIFKYSAGILEWKSSELKKIDRKSRKTMTIYGAFHPKSDVDRLNMKRKEGGRGLSNMELVVKREEKNLGQYVLNSREQLLRGVCFEGTIRTDSTMPNKEFKKKVANDLENNWMGKNMYSQFVREMPENVDKKKTWQCLSKSDLQVQTKALLCAAQEQAIRTNYVKHHIDKSVDSPLCRICGERGETVQHIVPEVAVENDSVKIPWDINIQCDNVIEARRPDIVLVDKSHRICTIIDIAVPANVRVAEKERETIGKYHDLKREVTRLWSMRKVQVIPVVIGALGSISKEFEKWTESLKIPWITIEMQKTALLGTATILRRVLDM